MLAIGEAVDVTAALLLSRLAGAAPTEAASLGNLVASVPAVRKSWANATADEWFYLKALLGPVLVKDSVRRPVVFCR